MKIPQDENEVMVQEPLLNSSPPSKGGFKTLPFILVNAAFERLANQGVISNLITYLRLAYGMGNASAANVIFYLQAASNFTPVLGAFLADSSIGRYRIISWGSIISFLGTILLWLTTILPRSSCVPESKCEYPEIYQYALLYASFVLLSIGTGGVRASSLSFGTDQLEKGDHLKSGRMIENFLSWYYFSSPLAVLGALTCLVYIQEYMGWIVGYGVPCLLMLLSALSFFIASPIYIKKEPNPNLYTGFVHVLVASFKNRSVEVSSEVDPQIYHKKKDSTLEFPSDKLRFLNKACIIRDPQRDLTPDGEARDPRILCTIDEVEEAKSIIGIFPIWSTGIMMAVSTSQSSLVIIEASSMDRHINSSFEIPAASFASFMIFAISIWVALYDRIIIPLFSKIKGRRVYLNPKQKMGIGLIISCGSMASLVIVEIVRKRVATAKSLHLMSAMWLLPHLILAGVAEALNGIGQNEFYYSELPKNMSSVALNIQGVGMSIANLVSSFILIIVNNITTTGRKSSWISDNIDDGHYEYYYLLLTGLCLLNFIYFIACSKA